MFVVFSNPFFFLASLRVIRLAIRYIVVVFLFSVPELRPANIRRMANRSPKCTREHLLIIAYLYSVQDRHHPSD